MGPYKTKTKYVQGFVYASHVCVGRLRKKRMGGGGGGGGRGVGAYKTKKNVQGFLCITCLYR